MRINKANLYAAGMSVVLATAVASVALAGRTNQPATSTTDLKPDAPGAKVTLIGILSGSDLWARPGQPEEKAPSVPIFFAFEGTPEINAAFKDIFKDLIASNSINYQQSKTIEEELHKRLKYYVTEAPQKAWHSSNINGTLQCVTGVVSEKDGKKWVTPSKITDRDANNKGLLTSWKLPAGFYAPDKPFKMPGKTPLMLNVTDTLALKCILLPRGDFMFRKPFWYPFYHWQDEYPRHVTLTKPFWLAECPVTQEMWDAIMGAETDFSTTKGPQRPARNMTCAEILKFCKALSDKNNRTVRLPTDAEWEYAARSGTSNPQLPEKYKDQDCTDKIIWGANLPVKSKQPNAWGIYDLFTFRTFEVVRDKSRLYFHEAEVDPWVSAEADEAAGKWHKHFGNPNLWFHEEIPSVRAGGRWTDTTYASPKIRVAVDATPEEIAEMEKAEKK